MLQVERRFLEFDVGIDLVSKYGRSQLAMLHLQDHLRQAGDPCCRLGMPDIGFDGTDGTELLFHRQLLECLSQSGNFDAVAQLRARTMTFNIADGFRIDMPMLEGMAD